MKRFLLILLALLLLTGCGAYKPAGEPTGNAELDAQVLAVLEEVCTADTLAENAALVYSWVAMEMTYRASTADTSAGYTDAVVQELALEMLNKRRGACDSEAAVMAVLLDRMGCESVVVEGTFLREEGTEPVEHAWVIAQVDGEYYHFDPLYGRYYAEDRISDYCMAPDTLLLNTHQWDQTAYPACE